MLSRYRESVRTWSDPVGRALFRLRLRPNHLTMCGLLVSACAGAAFVFGHVRLAGFLLILAGLFDLFHVEPAPSDAIIRDAENGDSPHRER